jgi:GNAT superfamily N-acetyltransferase
MHNPEDHRIPGGTVAGKISRPDLPAEAMKNMPAKNHSMEPPGIITLNAENITDEHICCAIGEDKTNQARANLKKEWLREQFDNGFVFKKINVRGKAFIEYVPAEYAWKPVEAPVYQMINCCWVSGRYKGRGYGRLLMEECIRDARDKNGLVVVTGRKTMPWLTPKKFFQKFGFQTCDEAPPAFELLVRKNRQGAPDPRFREVVRSGTIEDKDGVVIMYSDQCPFHEDFVGIMLATARDLGLPAKKVKIDNLETAQQVPYPTGLAGIYLNGKFLSYEITTAKRFEKMLRQHMG